MTDPKIVMAQINPVLGDFAGNAQQIEAAYQEFADSCDLIVTPEMSLSGYQCEDLTERPAFLAAAMTACEELAKKVTGQAGLLVGLPTQSGGAVYNSCALLHQGRMAHIQHKHHLPNEGVFDDQRHFVPGPLPDCLTIHGHRLGILICEDSWADDVVTHLVDQGAECLISLNGSVYGHGLMEDRLYWARRHVQAHHIPFYYSNLVGGQDEIVFDGRSFALDSQGDMRALFPAAKPYTGRADLMAAPAHSDALDYDIITLGLRDYVRKNGFERVLIGLSGGIDSALVTVMAVDALGPENVSCVMLPSPFTADQSIEDAKALCDALGCSYRAIPITQSMAAMEVATAITRGLAHENMQSRLRAVTLMSLSNHEGSLLLSTGNKSEMAVGYATLYGDMCGAYNPLKDVYKTLVYRLARERNKRSSVIPETIIERPPSAELRADQLDTDSLPDYEILDSILSEVIEKRLDASDVAAHGFDPDVVRQVITLLARSEYKRRQAPPGPKITRKAFGRDRRHPMTNRYDWA